ncbi:IclR family transcriptional regulator [Streptomyces purpurogeneiscleroticus]|uniref:IclR family transcriptional regulator n=1 Tax=Streptomyces purpurogeneiscleroticus TaxID=68259 RepID=UPI001CC03ABD|nr:IclR family transcriptional regulator [Streptomyces purpurogeneiscleroticus]MBZ4019654.1 IclR family transcriptional regulator [Streptomyces purpurogeneiscleroticus]
MSNYRTEPAGASSGGVQSVDRAVSVLELLAQHGEAGVSDVAAALGVHKSTAFRLLGALEARGMVEQESERGKYRLGFGIVRLAGAVTARIDITKHGRKICERLAGKLGETMNIAVLESHYVINLDQVRGPSAITAQNWVGRLTPPHCTSSGKVLLAHLSPERRRALLAETRLARMTPRTLTSRKKLEAALAETREQGYAITMEEYEEGLNAVAAPVRSRDGETVAALTASGPAFRFTEERMHELAPALVAGAEELSRRLGYPG